MSIRAPFHSVFALMVFGGTALSQAPAAIKPAADPTFRVTFKGGTLQEYIDLVRQQVPDANIVVDSGMGTVHLPPAALTRVSLSLALQWIQRTSDATSRGLTLRPVTSGRDSATVFVFTGPLPLVDHQVKAYSLTDEAREPASPEAVRTALRNLLQSRKDATIATADYDAQIGIITVAGRRSEIVLADQLMSAVAQSRRGPSPMLQRLQAQVDSLRARVAELQAKTGPTPSRP